jgi:hypothetical protein
MLAVEMLNDEKIIEGEDELFLTQPGGIPQNHVLLFTFFDRGKLQIAKCGALLGIVRGWRSHGASLGMAIVTRG